MTIYFNIRNRDHNYKFTKDFKYEVEGVTRLFFPCFKIGVVFDDVGHYETDTIIAYLRRGRTATRVLVFANIAASGWKQFCETFDNNTQVAYEEQCERVLCKGVYLLLSQICGFSPSWGTLTGIRPVKFVNNLRAEGMDDGSIRTFFQREFLVSDRKLDTAFTIADVQRPLLAKKDPRSFSLYISIPFCPSRCSYCSFVSHSIAKQKHLIPDYIRCVCEEIRYTGELVQMLGLKLETVYVGGGTPTSLEAEQLGMILDCVAQTFDLKQIHEFTVEAGRADTITKEKLEVIKQSGVGRISINPQSFNDHVLRAVGRLHTAQDVIDCYRMARTVGFENINMDFIAGLPADTPESFADSLQTAIGLAPENITVHTLSIKRSSDLYPHGAQLDIDSARKNAARQMVAYSAQALQQAGYLPYYLYRQKNTVENLENTGYAKPGHIGLYNVYIMDEVHTIVAVGAAGVTKLVHPNGERMKINRVANFKYPLDYIKQFDRMLARKQEVVDFYAKLLQS